MIRFAQVTAVHPERRTVDLVFMDDGWRCAEVYVLPGAVSSDSGLWDVPDVPKPQSEAQAGGLNATGRNIVAACAMAYGRPVVMGFLDPAGSMMRFKQQNREVHRHVSGAYTTVAPDGSIEVFHPAGAYLRIGVGEHEDLAPLAADGNWTIPPGAPPAQITLVTSGFKATVMPGGNTEIDTNGTVTVKAQGAVLVQAPSVTLDTPTTHCTGDLTVDKLLTYKGGMQGSTNVSGATATIQGNVTVTSGEVTVDGIGVKGHHHLDPQGGVTGSALA